MSDLPPPSGPVQDEAERQRLQTLQDYAVLDTAPEAGFDELTHLAAQWLQVPIVLISLVDAERQWFKSRVGLEAPETPRSVSFCSVAIERPQQMLTLHGTCCTPSQALRADCPPVLGGASAGRRRSILRTLRRR